MNPFLSIIIPTYNRSNVIARTVNSIIMQTFNQWECLIVDDGSSDNTKDIIEKFTKLDHRIKYYVNEHKKGAQGARNTGLYKSKTDWVLFFDSDDIMFPTLLEELTNCIRDGIDAVSCFSNIVDVNNGNTGRFLNSVNEGNIHKKLFTGECYVGFDLAIIRKSKLIAIGGLDENCPSMQEWDTHIRLSVTANYTTVQKALVDYYVGGKDAISSDTKREVVGRLYILHKHRQEWRKNKNGLVAFVRQINNLIKVNADIGFRRRATIKLFCYAPNACVSLLVGQMKSTLYGIFKSIWIQR